MVCDGCRPDESAMKDAVKHAVKHIVKQSKTPAAESAPETASFERTPKAMLLGAVWCCLAVCCGASTPQCRNC